MKNALDFIGFALSHAKCANIPENAELPISQDECGTEEWEYLPGTAGESCTRELVEAKFEQFYKPLGTARERYDLLTGDFAARGVRVCDSMGLVEAFTGVRSTPNFLYSALCTDKGRMEEVYRAFALGEALFFGDEDGRKLHVGFVCGFAGGEPLVVEARGLAYGVCVSRLTERPWTHRGLATKVFNYGAECVLEQQLLTLTKPYIRGERIRTLQLALNALGYPCGVPDGILGEQTMAGINDFVDAQFRSRLNKKRA